MSLPLAYHLTWTTHGSWLPGDERGWVTRDEPGIQDASSELHAGMRASLAHEPVKLSEEEREIVRQTIERHCEIRGWKLHALNVRSNHVHCVVTAGVDPDTVVEQLKAWCTRKLNPLRSSPPKHWWTRGQSTKYINDETYLKNAILYVLEGQ